MSWSLLPRSQSNSISRCVIYRVATANSFPIRKWLSPQWKWLSTQWKWIWQFHFHFAETHFQTENDFLQNENDFPFANSFWHKVIFISPMKMILQSSKMKICVPTKPFARGWYVLLHFPLGHGKIILGHGKLILGHGKIILSTKMKTSKWKWTHFEMKMKWVLPAGDPEMTFAKWIQNHFANQNESVKMKMDSFQNENEMSSAGRGPQNDFRKMSLVPF